MYSYDLSCFRERNDDSDEAPRRQRRRLENTFANVTIVVMIWHFLSKIGANVRDRLVHVRAAVTSFLNGRDTDVQHEVDMYPDGLDIEGAMAVASVVIMPPAHCGVCLCERGCYEKQNLPGCVVYTR